MTVSFANVNVATDTFDIWVARTNDLVAAMRTKVVTADSNTTVGNVAISGTFTSAILVANSAAISANVVANNLVATNNVTANVVSVTNGITANTLVLGTKLGIASGGTNANSVAGARSQLGVNIGSDVQAYHPALQSISGLATTGNTLIYASGANTYTTTTLSVFARTILDDADAATVRTTISAQTLHPALTSISGLTTAANTLVYASAANTYSTTALTGFARTILDDGDAATVRTTIGAYPIAGGSGSPITGQLWVTSGNATASSSLVILRPTDYGTGKPQFSVFKHGTANRYDVMLYDGVDNAGIINILSSTFQFNGVNVATTTGVETFQNKTIDRPYIVNGYTEENFAFNSGATGNVDLTNGSVQLVTLTANWTPSAIPLAVTGRGFVLLIKQDATGGRTITWPANVKWPADIAPALTATASRADKIAFQCIDGTNWHANVVGQNYGVV